MKYPSNPAPTGSPLPDVIRERWSPYSFSNEEIGDEKIKILFEAARWAPSSYNEQPWRYVYAGKNDPDRAALESLLLEGNSWSKGAGLLIVSFAKKTFTYNGKENRHALHDLGCASGYLVLQATALGLVSHQMAGFAVDRANEILGVPDDFIPGSVIAIGEPGDPAATPPPLREREQAPRSRRPAEKFAFRGRFEK
jgi:nitroreductase